MAYSIAIVGKRNRNFTDAEKSVKSLAEFRVHTFHEAKEFTNETRYKKFHALVLTLDFFGPEQVKLLKKINEVYPDSPVVILAEEIDRLCLNEVKSLKKKVVLEQPSETKDLAGIVHRLIASSDESYYRQHRRHRTLQYAFIGDEHAPKGFNAKVIDLSTSGAQVQAFKGVYEPGDEIVLHIPLQQLNKTHKVKGKVLWVNREETYSVHSQNITRIGVAFVA